MRGGGVVGEVFSTGRELGKGERTKRGQISDY